MMKASVKIMADFFNVSPAHINRQLNGHKYEIDNDGVETDKKIWGMQSDFSIAYYTSLGNTRMALIQKQIERALEGDTVLLKWLGKQLLDQKEPEKIDERANQNITFNITAAEESL